MTATKISGPLLQYPGGKWSMAPWIVSHFPKHTAYIEPFFGGGSILFQKQIAAYEVVNDKSGDVVNLFTMVRDQGAELARLIELTPYARDEYNLSYEPAAEPLERARRFIIRVRMSHSSDLTARVGWRHGLKSENGTGNYQAWQNVPARILEVCQRLKSVEIENRDALAVIKASANPDTLIYADPPYVRSTRVSDMYQHEMSDDQHIELLEALDFHPGPVVLSGYRCKLYDDRLTYWRRVDYHNRAGSGAKRVESLWLNPRASATQQTIMDL